VIVSIILLVCLVLFYRLRITIDGETLCASFGIGIICKKVRLADIVGCEPIRIRWWYGWGIHLTPWGWLYNVSGLDAVAITLPDPTGVPGVNRVAVAGLMSFLFSKTWAVAPGFDVTVAPSALASSIAALGKACARARDCDFLNCAAVNHLQKKTYFGPTPKPARATRALAYCSCRNQRSAIELWASLAS
jgi:hypothetical protein